MGLHDLDHRPVVHRSLRLLSALRLELLPTMNEVFIWLSGLTFAVGLVGIYFGMRALDEASFNKLRALEALEKAEAIARGCHRQETSPTTPTGETAVCGDVEFGAPLVYCVCGKFRQYGRSCGFTESRSRKPFSLNLESTACEPNCPCPGCSTDTPCAVCGKTPCTFIATGAGYGATPICSEECGRRFFENQSASKQKDDVS